jgi:CheY-like chemotaxis protein
MIVEDERIIALDIQSLLTQAGFPKPSVYSSGESAIDALDEEEPDLILMDIMLKGSMDGFTAVENIQKRRQIPVIYITALMDAATREKALSLSSHEIIGKPIHVPQLLDIVERALANQSS